MVKHWLDWLRFHAPFSYLQSLDYSLVLLTQPLVWFLTSLMDPPFSSLIITCPMHGRFIHVQYDRYARPSNFLYEFPLNCRTSWSITWPEIKITNNNALIWFYTWVMGVLCSAKQASKAETKARILDNWKCVYFSWHQSWILNKSYFSKIFFFFHNFHIFLRNYNYPSGFLWCSVFASMAFRFACERRTQIIDLISDEIFNCCFANVLTTSLEDLRGMCWKGIIAFQLAS